MDGNAELFCDTSWFKIGRSSRRTEEVGRFVQEIIVKLLAKELAGRNPNGARFASSKAEPSAVRRPEVPPRVAIATITVRRARQRT